MKELLRAYSKRLTNLTGKNRSILMLRLSAQTVDLHSFHHLNKEGSFKILENLIGGKKAVLCPEMDARDDDVNIVSRRLRRINRWDKFIFEERGSKDLYVGWPILRGKFSDGTPLRCALTYIPVSIEINKGNWEILPRKEEEIKLNKSFLLAYGHYNGIKIDDTMLEQNLEELDDDMTVYRTSLYQLMSDSNIEINFNRDNFMDELQSFEEFKRDDFESKENNGEIKLFPEAVLGIFPQSGSNLVQDYTALSELNQFKDLDEFFEERSASSEDSGHSPYYFLGQISEEKTFTPFKLDAYQENALKAVKKGYSIVVQGPPGTGKSQLICNLVSDFIARDKNVLVVCQKRAALDVVYQRLSDKFLSDFIGLVHDFSNDRKSIYEKIARQIRMIPEYEHQNNSLDFIQMERKFLQTSRKIDQVVEEMEEFKQALFDTSECGVSVKELYLTSDIDKPVFPMRREYNHFHFDTLEDFKLKLRDYAEYGKKFNKANYPLLERKSFKGYGVTELKKMEEILVEIPKFQAKIQERTSKILQHPISVEESEMILSRRPKIIEMLNILKDEDSFRFFKSMIHVHDKDTDLLWLSNTERVFMECYKGHGPETTIKSEELGLFQEALDRWLEARKRWVGIIRWKLFSRDIKMLKGVLKEYQLKFNKEGRRTLVEMIDNRLNLEHNLSKLREIKWISDIPDTYEKVELQNWFHMVKQAMRAKMIFTSLRQFYDYFNTHQLDQPTLSEKLEELFKVIHEIPERRNIWELYFSKNQITNLLNNPDLSDRLLKALKKDFDSLCEFDALTDELPEHELKVMNLAVENSPQPDVDTIVELFDNSLRIAWIDHIEAKYPMLRSVSSMKFRKEEADLQNAVKEKLQISNDILLLKARERTYKGVEYNRLNNRVTYRDLDHQVNKKRRIWPLRKLIDNFHEELFDLIPCWMASPESVSAIFPMMNVFDLVIFDEASQCFVEQGIPAMYRGKQLVIAGDDKQLRPNDLYQIRYEEDIDDDPSLEISSVLDLADRHLMQVSLQGHYRSKSLDLIDFSNQRFYDGNLTLLPDRIAINRHEPAIHYVKIDGIWEKNRNEAEAHKIVELVQDILAEDDSRSIGIVTFNIHQQELIMDLLDEKAMATKTSYPDSLFVKNIENVQGDERDVIIFSVGYAPDKSGRMAMQFGSLNAEFGENRLNVAITRAIEKIFLVTSISPQQLKVDESKNHGPRLLRDYLEYGQEVSEGRFSPYLVPANKQEGWYLKEKLRKWGEGRLDDIVIDRDMPFADLTVREGQKYIGVVRLDDELYFQSPSVKDAHVYTPFTFSAKKWSMFSLTSREYWNNKEEALDRATTFINNHREES